VGGANLLVSEGTNLLFEGSNGDFQESFRTAGRKETEGGPKEERKAFYCFICLL